MIFSQETLKKIELQNFLTPRGATFSNANKISEKSSKKELASRMQLAERLLRES